ncbi:D-glycero-beta-D-manno-heptose-7-phosphate kinase [Candidatus Aerophobetes bacterium]|uniref:D-glycero-beta-D-manno-heptose-7-phosphate kinase n=1 Tax=Aerophobetes bacterium TaxID=2030807 RepID=A0A2A4X6P1_UNCAE|nr:MAG: D-glycero-beta-D-manno-heptose-7-phosphate kinase [Candidatus Aerophobetes bacterium]
MHYSQVLEKIKNPKVLLLGDFVFDQYQFGVVERISPEAPVPVLKTVEEKFSPGGAGNVVLNLKAMGAEVVAMGRVGVDYEGESLLQILEAKGVDVSGVIKQPQYPTPTKTRYIAQSQQLLRVDREDNMALPAQLQDLIFDQLDEQLDLCDIVALSDYDKGFFSPGMLLKIIKRATSFGKKVIVDPKGKDFSKYQGAFLIKPNEKEALLASGGDQKNSLGEIGRNLYSITKSPNILITRSSKGMSLISGGSQINHFPIHSSEVVDVTGAGDTVLSMLVVALASGLALPMAIGLANLAAGESIKHIGCYAPSIADLKKTREEEEQRVETLR